MRPVLAGLRRRVASGVTVIGAAAAWVRSEFASQWKTRINGKPRKPNLCRCGCGSRTAGRFAPGHDQRHLGQCLDRISAGDPTGADDLEQDNPGHAKHYDMACLRANVGQKREELRKCFRG